MAAEPFPHDPEQSSSWLICAACGTQFPTGDRQALTTCFICDDPRQFTPQTGQSFTTLDELRLSHRNTWTPLPDDERFISIVTEPKVGIGQRCILVQTEHGNILWDCITLIDEETVDRIRAMGGLKAIVISHPHYYSTHLEWARALDCPVYLAAEDKRWTTQFSRHQVFIHDTEMELEIDGARSGVRVLKLGDTLVTTPSGLGNWDADATGNERGRPEGMNSYSFMWSIPNFIPLAPSELVRMWGILRKYSFKSTHGAFLMTDIVRGEGEMKQRVLESMQIQIRYMGHEGHAFLRERVHHA